MVKKTPKSKTALELPPGVVQTQKDLAAAVDRKVRTIGYWIKEGMPVNDDGTYHIAKIVEWRTTLDLEQKYGARIKNEAEDTLDQIKTEKARLELDKMKGLLIPEADVRAENKRKIIALKTALLTVPKRLATKVSNLPEKSVYEILKHEITKMISHFAGEVQ